MELEDTSGGVKIELKDVYFKYPTRDIPIFKGLNLTVRIVIGFEYLLIIGYRLKRVNLRLLLDLRVVERRVLCLSLKGMLCFPTFPTSPAYAVQIL